MTRNLLIVAAVIGGLISVAGGPIAWAVMVMIGVPFALLIIAGSAGHGHSDVEPGDRCKPE